MCLRCMWHLVSLLLVVSTSAINCLQKLIFEMTCYVSSGSLNPMHSLTSRVEWVIKPYALTHFTCRVGH